MAANIRRRLERLERRSVGAPVLVWCDPGDTAADLAARASDACARVGAARERARVFFLHWRAEQGVAA